MPDLQPVFDELCRRLSVHEGVFALTDNPTDANAVGGRRADESSPDSYLLLGAPTESYPGGVSFAGVRLGKRYVSYYLMSVHLRPDTVISPELAKRRQGKSCFNFTKIDEGLFDELADLTAAGREFYAEQGLLRR